MSVELVPVKTKYPSTPPASEPRWVHLDWIQTTAASMAEWAELAERRKRWQPGDADPLVQPKRKRREHADPHVQFERERRAFIQLEMKQWARLWGEVLPLFRHAQAYLPLEVLSQFKHIRTPHAAERSPGEAVAEWAILCNSAMDRLASDPILSIPMAKKEIAERLGINTATLELDIKSGVIELRSVSRQRWQVVLSDGNRGFFSGPQK